MDAIARDRLSMVPNVTMFNYSQKSGQVASEWKCAKVTPIPKGKGTEEVDNFHPVSVLLVVSKVKERLVHHAPVVYIPAEAFYPPCG